MGLDAYIRCIHDRHKLGEFEYDRGAQYHEVLYWRKNHKLHKWMNRVFLERLYTRKGNIQPEFNCVPLYLNELDLTKLLSQSADPSSFYYGILDPNDEEKLDECIHNLQNVGDINYFYFAWY